MLKDIGKFPPGGFPYIQEETGFKFKGMTDFSTQCHNILRHRKGNALPNATLVAVAEDLDRYTCEMLGYDPKWFVSAAKNVVITTVARKVRGCSSCGGRRKKAG